MKAKTVLALVMILVLLMASGASVAAGGAGAPFKAVFHATCWEVSCDPDTGICLYGAHGEGRATYLGNSSFDIESGIDWSQDPPYYWADFTMPGAHGGQLFGTVEAYFTSIPSGAIFEGTFQITGGDGRFEGVTGSGVFWAWTDGSGFNDWVYFDGTLTKP